MTPTDTPQPVDPMAAVHSIVNVTHRGILGGYAHWCSCGASIIEPDGGHGAVDAHLADPPSPRRPTIRERMGALVVRARSAESERDAARAEVERLRAGVEALYERECDALKSSTPPKTAQRLIDAGEAEAHVTFADLRALLATLDEENADD